MNYDEKFYAPLRYGNKKEIERLLKGGFNINQINRDLTPLIYCILHDNVEMARFLLEKGADVNFKDDHWRKSPIGDACDYYNSGKPEMLNLLLEFGAEYNKEELLKLCPEKAREEVREILDSDVVCIKPPRV